MILSDGSIKDLVENTDLVKEHVSDEQIQPASLDVRLGQELYDIEADKRTNGKTHGLKPHRRYLGHTVETINLPDTIAAQLAGRSTIGRQGVIVHKTAGWIDPGFEGQITLELYNLGTETVYLHPGERVAQLIFSVLDYPSSGYDGQYQGQEGATEAGQ